MLIYQLLLALCFAKIGSKRVMGSFSSFWWVLLSPIVGVLFVLASRRLDDEKKNRELVEKYRPANKVVNN